MTCYLFSFLQCAQRQSRPHGEKDGLDLKEHHGHYFFVYFVKFVHQTPTALLLKEMQIAQSLVNREWEAKTGENQGKEGRKEARNEKKTENIDVKSKQALDGRGEEKSKEKGKGRKRKKEWMNEWMKESKEGEGEGEGKNTGRKENTLEGINKSEEERARNE